MDTQLTAFIPGVFLISPIDDSEGFFVGIEISEDIVPYNYGYILVREDSSIWMYKYIIVEIIATIRVLIVHSVPYDSVSRPHEHVLDVVLEQDGIGWLFAR